MQTELTPPGLWRRMACWLYEGMLMFGVVFLAGYLFSTLSQTRNAMDNRHALQAVLFVIFGIYFVWFWAKGQTLAMKTWRIKLCTRTGMPVRPAQAVLRFVLCWPSIGVFGIGIFWALVDCDRQFLHDRLAGTRLVKS